MHWSYSVFSVSHFFVLPSTATYTPYMTELAKQLTKRPITVEAMQWRGDNLAELREWTDRSVIMRLKETSETEYELVLYERHHKAWLVVHETDWVFRDQEGGFYPVTDSIKVLSYMEGNELMDALYTAWSFMCNSKYWDETDEVKTEEYVVAMQKFRDEVFHPLLGQYGSGVEEEATNG